MSDTVLDAKDIAADVNGQGPCNRRVDILVRQVEYKYTH